MELNLENDILPVGDFETIPVVSVLEPIPENYPNYIRLNVSVDVDKLREEYHLFPKENKKHYFRHMAKHFKSSVKEAVSYYMDLGFVIENYKVYPLRVIGSNILSENVGPYTREVLETIGVPLFRQQYVYATKDWETQTHIDHPNFSIHGFRMFIPIDEVNLIVDNEEIILKPGYAYYVNIAKPHKGWATSDRIVIMAQMASDKLIQEVL